MLTATVVAFACGSSSVQAANEVGKPLRWALLLVLLCCAAVWAVAQGRPAIPARSATISAAGFLAVALASALWSVDARLTFERAISLTLLFVTAWLLAVSADEAAASILAGVLAGAVVVAIAGLLTLALDRHAAIQPATDLTPSRYQGFGENPNTASLLFALALPLAVGFALRARDRRACLVPVGIVLLLDGSIVASDSRGALGAAFIGAVVVIGLVPVAVRTRVLAACALAVLLAASIGGELIPKPAHQAPAPAAAAKSAAPAPAPKPAARQYVNVERIFPLAFDIGSYVPGNTAVPRSFLGSSGRSIAWRGALDLANERPALGYGFGTESRVFVDRYALFTGDLVENSYIGLDLQLGAIGLAAFLVLAGALLVPPVRARRFPFAPECAGVVVSGLVLALVQSYVYSVGDIGTATLWICAFLGAAAMSRKASRL